MNEGSGGGDGTGRGRGDDRLYGLDRGGVNDPVG